MAWPTDGTDGWESLGTAIEEAPRSHPLPVVRRSAYYDPTALGGVGQPTTQVEHQVGESTVVVRIRAGSVEAEFLQPEVYGAAVLDSFVVPPLIEPCSVVLEVFDDDRETVLWRVGTSIAEPYPYLLEPDRYAEQEIDPATGGATVGTVTVLVIDPAIEPGVQVTGWLTAKLAALGVPDLAGRRCLLRRWIDDDLGYQVLADGPASSPRLDSSYAAFSWEIRDTRETERKVRLFDGGGGIEAIGATGTFNPTGAKTIMPDGVYGGYGYEASLGTYLIDPAEPLLGRFKIGAYPGIGYSDTGSIQLTATPGNATAQRLVSFAGSDAMRGTYEIVATEVGFDTITYEYITRFEDLLVLWRAAGSSDPWNEIGGRNLIVHGAATEEIDGAAAYFETNFAITSPYPTLGTATGKIASSVLLGDARGAAYLPAPNEDVEFFVVYRGEPSEDLPVYVEGLTAGQFTANVYAGIYSARDENGDVAPTGIRYSEPDVLAMTHPVRIRLTEPIEDARDWLESRIYAPLGYAPALNILGEIAPVSQIAPTSTDGLDRLDDSVCEPAPSWSSGERIVNVLRYVYQRDYEPAVASNAETGDGLADREVIVEFEDPVSVARHGRQELEIDGEAFRAVGDSLGDPVDTLENEWSYLLALLRQEHVQARYSLGAPTMRFAVRRSAVPLLRCGAWVVLDLSWMPDYVTGERGLLALGQVVAIGDLDCAWREVTVEQVTPLPAGS